MGNIEWTEHQIQLFCLDLDYQVYSQWFVNADCAGWDMTKESQKIFCTESLLLENAILGVPSYTTEMCENET